ncbi:hypothetical protein GCM10020331_088830 [Ectobacillus funiculus]
MLEEVGLPVLEEDGKILDVHSFQMVEVCMYFSAITLLSVGYGDITPVGIGRWIAIIEALVGYTMPAAFVARTFMEHEKNGIRFCYTVGKDNFRLEVNST